METVGLPYKIYRKMNIAQAYIQAAVMYSDEVARNEQLMAAVATLQEAKELLHA